MDLFFPEIKNIKFRPQGMMKLNAIKRWLTQSPFLIHTKLKKNQPRHTLRSIFFHPLRQQ